MKRFFQICILPLIAATLLLGGCAGTRRTVDSESRVSEKKGREKIPVEAYLFDAKIKRNKKTNSFRLDVFQTDSIMSIGGRGYLGKGAMKGWMTSDSLQVLFPLSNEFVHEPVSTLLRSFECTFDMPEIDLLAFFMNRPDDMVLDSRITVEPDYSKGKRPSFKVYVSDCPWVLNLEYDEKRFGWRIRSFDFSDGQGNTLKATRREYKRNAKVKPDRFSLEIPLDAYRIIP